MNEQEYQEYADREDARSRCYYPPHLRERDEAQAKLDSEEQIQCQGCDDSFPETTMQRFECKQAGIDEVLCPGCYAWATRPMSPLFSTFASILGMNHNLNRT